MTGILNLLAGAVGVVKDTYFNLVTLLLPGDGTNGAQNNTFLDSSTNNFTITRNGNTTQGTFSPFSQTGWSNYFGGGTNYLTVPDSTDLQFGTGDFTISAWIYLNSTSSEQSICCKGGTTTGWAFNINSSGKLMWLDTTSVNTAATTLATNVWHYVVASRVGSTVRLFLNGTQDLSVTLSTNYNQTNLFNIGLSRDGNWPVNGYISNLKVVKGSGVSSVTVPSSPETSTTGTSLLTCQSNRFVDANTQVAAKTITVNGTPSVQAFSPFAPTAAYSASTNGGSGYFDGTGDYLSAGSNAAFAFGTGAYTVEVWLYPTTIDAIDIYVATDATNGFQMYQDTGRMRIGQSGVGVVVETAAGVLTANAWNHIVVCRASTSANQASIFINGSRRANGTDATNWSVTGPLVVSQATYPVNGYMTSVRVVKGTDVYGYNNTSITVPTAPLTAITNTSLLLNFTNAGITDATAKNDLETVGNAQISTTQSKWGGSSISFNGTNSYLRPNSGNVFNFGTGDFTIEFWLYLNSVASQAALIDCRPGSAGDYILFDYDPTAKLRLFVNTTTVLSGSTLATGQWYHIALARSGSTVRYFIDGTQGASATMTTNLLSAANPYIGANYVPGSYLNAYIDDLRVTKGYARYTANFTPPTAAFALQ